MSSFEVLFNFFDEPEKTEAIGHALQGDFTDLEDKEKAVQIIAEFVGYFSLFKNLNPLRLELWRCILDSIQMTDKVSDLAELMQKDILLRLVEMYIEYEGLGQKEKIINILSTSLETLAPGPLFLNLGILVRPIFEQDSYRREQAAKEEREIVYSIDYKTKSNFDLEIKQVMDKWIKAQQINLDTQDSLRRALQEKFNEECKLRSVSPRDDLFFQVQEMLNMQLTIASLQMSLGEEDLAPTPIH